MATRKTTTAGAPAQGNKPAAKAASPARKAATAKVPAAEKPIAPATAVQAASSSAPAPAPVARKAAVVTPEQRANYIEVAAFYIAERRGFVSGDPMADWLEAQAEIDRAIAKGLLGQR